jgi:hypothetical protein
METSTRLFYIGSENELYEINGRQYRGDTGEGLSAVDVNPDDVAGLLALGTWSKVPRDVITFEAKTPKSKPKEGGE